MTQGVPSDTLRPRVLKRRHIHSTIEVVSVQVRFGVLTWEHPDRLIARNEAAQDRLGLLHRVDILHVPRLGVGEGDQSCSRSMSAHREPNCSDFLKPVRMASPIQASYG